jgi:hypothetical protein
MLKLMWGACLLLVAIVVVAIVWPATTGAPTGAWGTLTPGSPAASSPNLMPNGGFEGTRLAGWAHRQNVIAPASRLPNGTMDTELPEGMIDPRAGRTGGAFRLGDQRAKRADVAASWTKPITHCDWFLDGYARAEAKRGKGWVGIEFLFEDGKGLPIASYLCWRGLNGGAPDARPGRLLRELAPAEGGWGRVPIRTAHDLQQHGLAMPRKPEFLTVNLWLSLEDCEADAWFEDLDLRDMRMGR